MERSPAAAPPQARIRRPRRPRAARARELGAAREVLRRRRERLRRQPRRLRGARSTAPASTTSPRRPCSFLVAVTNNYSGTGSGRSAASAATSPTRGCASSSSRVVALGANLVVLRAPRRARLGKIVAQAIAIVLVTPLNFLGNKLWSFRRRVAPLSASSSSPSARSRSRRRPAAAPPPTAPVYDAKGRSSRRRSRRRPRRRG